MRPCRVLVLLSALAFASCDSVGPVAELLDRTEFTRDPTLLVGTWDLQRVTFFDRQSGRYVSHPPSEPARFVFSADGRYESYLGGGLQREGAFTVVEEACNRTGNCWNDVAYDGNPVWVGHNYYWVGVSEKWLVFDTRPVNGSENVYRRVPE